ncbi:uncharacterized protein LOC117118667 [Anneissia japonica]|uniref:uncharacterized protein LOC117118667 n=1 Tax=Anneissia japonica TaxID=1529436 RepID=UPI001425792B|nr:uncharacterized protein LOC117118667 [Anneissia japonica]
MFIESATPDDVGIYTCKAESNQLQGENGKTSNQIDLEVIGRPDSQSKECPSKPTDLIISLTAVIALVIGSVPTYLISRYIYKRKEKEIHHQYHCQNSQYQDPMEVALTPRHYEDLNIYTDIDTSNDDNNKAYSEVQSIYEDQVL